MSLAPSDADLRQLAAGLPEVVLPPEQIAAIDLVASGAVAPRVDVTLRAPVGTDPAPAAGGSVAVRDQEGVLLAVLRLRDAARTGDGWELAADVVAARRPDRPDYPELWRSAADTRRRVAERGWPEPVAAMVEEVPPTAAGFAEALAAARGRLLVIAAAPGAPDDPAHHARVRAWTRVVEPHRDGVELVLLPATLPEDLAGAAAFRSTVAANYGAARVVAAPDVDAAAARPARGGGATVLLTGLSGSGKSTIAGRLLVRLLATGRVTTLLDGDVVRTHLSKGLGFSRADRDTNVRRIGFVAAEITKHGGIAIAAPIAPYQETRQAVRAMVERYGSFVLVHVATPLEVCEARDRKGLYAKARAGEIPEFTGVSDPYEEPTDADLVIDTEAESPDEAAERVLAHLRRLGVLGGDGVNGTGEGGSR